MSVLIDKYGWPLKKAVDPTEAWHYYEFPYQEDTNETGKKYIRFYNENPCVIWKETEEAGVLTREFSYGDWSDRANLTYSPINEAHEVD